MRSAVQDSNLKFLLQTVSLQIWTPRYLLHSVELIRFLIAFLARGDLLGFGPKSHRQFWGVAEVLLDSTPSEILAGRSTFIQVTIILIPTHIIPLFMCKFSPMCAGHCRTVC